MGTWVVSPSLLTLRDEFNDVSPGRDKGADGTIGDTNHTSTSDHTPDEDSSALRNKDADNKNEVHGLDTDSSGPWPGCSTPAQNKAWFDGKVKKIVANHKAGRDDRLTYVIWDGQIASAAHGWIWRTYTGSADPHINHAHFSGGYGTAQESNTSRPWGVKGGTLMGVFDDEASFKAYMLSLHQTQIPAGVKKAITTDEEVKAVLVQASHDAWMKTMWNAAYARRAQVVSADGTITYVTGKSPGYDKATSDEKVVMRNAFDLMKELGMAEPVVYVAPKSSRPAQPPPPEK
jgi:hypothetical protein